MRKVRNNATIDRRKIGKVAMSDVARCTSSGGLFQPGARQSAKVAWIRAHALLVARVVGKGTDTTRSLFLVRQSNPTRLRVADSITGSLYCPRTGNCLSSDNLRLTVPAHDPAESSKILLATRLEK